MLLAPERVFSFVMLRESSRVGTEMDTARRARALKSERVCTAIAVQLCFLGLIAFGIDRLLLFSPLFLGGKEGYKSPAADDDCTA